MMHIPIRDNKGLAQIRLEMGDWESAVELSMVWQRYLIGYDPSIISADFVPISPFLYPIVHLVILESDLTRTFFVIYRDVQLLGGAPELD